MLWKASTGTREALWNSLKSFHSSVDGPWVVAGDFNAVVHDFEVMGSQNHNQSYSAFRECIEFCDFQDPGYQGPSFTWRRNSLRERLDRVLVNKEWLLHFSDMGVVHLPMFSSEHSPIWVRAGSMLRSSNKSKHFKFMAAWLGHASFGDLVRDIWNNGDSWDVNVTAFAQAAIYWNKNVFGHI